MVQVVQDSKPSKHSSSPDKSLYDLVLTKEAQAQITALQSTFKQQFADGFTRAEMDEGIHKIAAIVMADFDKADGIKDGVLHKEALRQKLYLVIQHPAFKDKFQGKDDKEIRARIDEKLTSLPDIMQEKAGVTLVTDMLKEKSNRVFNALDFNQNDVLDSGDIKIIKDRFMSSFNALKDSKDFKESIQKATNDIIHGLTGQGKKSQNKTPALQH